MDNWQTYLMSCPSMAPQPYCCLCGKAGKNHAHHVVRRSAGGTEGPTVQVCQTCHDILHTKGGIEFDYSSGIWLSTYSGEWAPVSVYDEQRDQESPTTVDLLGELADDIREMKRLADTMDYLLSSTFAEAVKVVDRQSLAEWISDELGVSPRSVDSYLSKRLAYASLPQECAALGISNGYKVFLLSQQHGLAEVLADFNSMSRAQFDAEYGLTKEVPKHECPECGRVHAIGDGHAH